MAIQKPRLEAAQASAVRFLDQAAPLLAPASPEQCLGVLYRLEAHKPASEKGVGDAEMDDAARAAFWADYLKDLAWCPLWALTKACDVLRVSEDRFFPSAGQILRAVRTVMDPLQADVVIATRLRDHVAAETYERPTDEEWSALRARVKAAASKPIGGV